MLDSGVDLARQRRGNLLQSRRNLGRDGIRQRGSGRVLVL